MCVQTQVWAYAQQVPLPEKSVLVALAWHRNSQTGRCDPSVGLLADDTGMGRRAVQRSLRQLAARGLIDIRIGGGRANTSAYLLAVDNSGNGVPLTPFMGLERASQLTERASQLTINGVCGTPELERTRRTTTRARAGARAREGDGSGTLDTRSVRKVAKDWIDEHGWPTGARMVRGEHGSSQVYDPLGMERPLSGWPHPKPSFDDVVSALASANGDLTGRSS